MRNTVHMAFAPPPSSRSRKMSLKIAMIIQIQVISSMNQNIERKTSQRPKSSDMCALLA
jgi:hypothetical protein